LFKSQPHSKPSSPRTRRSIIWPAQNIAISSNDVRLVMDSLFRGNDETTFEQPCIVENTAKIEAFTPISDFNEFLATCNLQLAKNLML
ncbi:MAG: hypothetical protein KIH69_002325, partial [Anaerolineae bacterium]|nr:hypothetical protein [Anaerolineae bacterium]